VDVVLEAALDRCDCRRCRALAQQLDALIPTPAHVAAYVAMGCALVLTSVLAAATLDWRAPRLLGMAILVGTVWSLCLLGAMAWGGARLVSADPLAWSGRATWPGWIWLNVAMWVVWLVLQAVTGAPLWFVAIAPVMIAVHLVTGRGGRRRRGHDCIRRQAPA
jgi:hypothetical protein